MKTSRNITDELVQKLNIDREELVAYYKCINRYAKYVGAAVLIFLCQAIVLAASYSERYEQSFAPAHQFWFWANIVIGLAGSGLVFYGYAQAYGFVDDLARKAGYDSYSIDQLRKDAS